MALDFSSAGAVPAQPATPPPAAQTGGLDFSKVGAVPATPQQSPQPPAPQPPAAPQGDPPSLVHNILHELIQDPNVQTSIGAFKGVGQTMGGLLQILGKGADKVAPAAPGQPHNEAAQHLQNAADWFNKNSELDGTWQHIGSFGEGIAEFLTPEALASLAKVPAIAGKVAKVAEATGAAQKYADAAKVTQVLEKYPRLKSLVGIGLAALRSGAEAGAQTYVKTGGDTSQAGQAAAFGAGGGAVLEGVPAAVRAIAKPIAAPSLAADAVEQTARGALGREIDATNATRVPAPPNPNAEPYTFHIGGTPTEDTTSGQIAQQPRKLQKGTRYLAGKGPSERQVWIDPVTHTPHAVDIGPMQEKPIQRVVVGNSVDHDATLANLPDVGGGRTRLFRSDSGLSPDYDPAANPTHYVDLPDSVGAEANPSASHRAPSYRMLDESKPGTVTRADSAGGGGELLTQDPNIAAAHLKSLDEIIRSPEFAGMEPEQQQVYRAQRADIRKQIAEQYQATKAAGTNTPNFKPIDSRTALSSSRTFDDAANHLYDSAKEVYEHANRVSGGQWQALKDTIKETSEKLAAEPNIPSNQAARAKLARTIRESEQSMSRILDDPANGIDRDDAARAVRMMHSQFVLKEAHEAIAPLYDIEQHLPLSTGQYKGYNGNRLGARWQSFLRDRPEARQILGSDRVDTLTKMFKSTETMAARKRIGQAVLAIGSALGGAHFGGYEGAAAGELGYLGIRQVLDGMVMNPKFAKNLLFAVDSGARPQNYAPGLAQMLKTTHQAARVAVPAAASAAVRSNPQPQGDGQ